MKYDDFKKMMDGIRDEIDFDLCIGLTTRNIVGCVAAYLYTHWADMDNCNVPLLVKVTENTVHHLIDA